MDSVVRVYIPTERAGAVVPEVARVAMAAGGLTRYHADGVWIDENGEALVEDVYILEMVASEERTIDTYYAVIDLVAKLLESGEKEVLVTNAPVNMQVAVGLRENGNIIVRGADARPSTVESN